MRLEFAEDRPDRIEVWRAPWKVKQLRTRRFDRLPDASDLVGSKIVYDDDVIA
jgi:hypothetical protein